MTSATKTKPFFNDLTLSSVEAEAIFAALGDLTSPGGHEEEIGTVAFMVLSMPAPDPTNLPTMTPEKLSSVITTHEKREFALRCAVLLETIDEKFTPQGKNRIREYAKALGFDESALAEVRKLAETFTLHSS